MCICNYFEIMALEKKISGVSWMTFYNKTSYRVEICYKERLACSCIVGKRRIAAVIVLWRVRLCSYLKLNVANANHYFESIFCEHVYYIQ